jgi:hypothetical protein
MDIAEVKPVRIVVVVDGGNVQSIYATRSEKTEIEAEVLDFDNARADDDDPHALCEARKRLSAARKKLRQIY